MKWIRGENRLLAVLFIAFIVCVGGFALAKAGGWFLLNSVQASSVKKNLEARYQDMLPHGTPLIDKGTFINFNGLMGRAMGQRHLNKAVKLNNGHLTDRKDDIDPSPFAQNVVELNDFLSAEGIPFVYVSAPHKNCKYDPQLPAGDTDYINQTLDGFLEILAQNNVNFLDLRESLHDDGMSHYDSFFVTDHHWKPETALWASGEILSHLHQSGYLPKPDPFFTDPENYHTEVYENWFLGANGKRTGIYYAGRDDISVMWPRFETDITMSVPSTALSRSGPFRQSLLFEERLAKPGYFTQNPYVVYTNGDHDLALFENAGAHLDSKILIIKDSFSLPLRAFLSVSVSHIATLDLRYYNQSLREFIEDYQPDIVMMIYNADIFFDTMFTGLGE